MDESRKTRSADASLEIRLVVADSRRTLLRLNKSRLAGERRRIRRTACRPSIRPGAGHPSKTTLLEE
jgi:hypothetical protein